MTYIIVTKNTDAIRNTLHSYEQTQLVGSQQDFMVWRWDNAKEDDLAKVEGDADYLGTVQLS